MENFDREAVERDVAKAFGKRKEPQGPEKFALNAKSSIKHVVGVISGKGGVGKSLVTGILATNLRRSGKKVGILDADITGPSIPKMFGVGDQMAYAEDGLLVPAITGEGIKVMSTNLVLPSDTDPVLWRGPMLMGALKQFFEDTFWGDLDYLLIDMPPGTGDVALTVFQSLPIEGVVIVSSPQDLVRLIVGKAVKMANMMDVPILGVVENMSYIECPDCGKKLEPFGPSHLLETTQTFNLAELGRLPIMPELVSEIDAGNIELALPEGLLPDAISTIEKLG